MYSRKRDPNLWKRHILSQCLLGGLACIEGVRYGNHSKATYGAYYNTTGVLQESIPQFPKNHRKCTPRIVVFQAYVPQKGHYTYIYVYIHSPNSYGTLYTLTRNYDNNARALQPYLIYLVFHLLFYLVLSEPYDSFHFYQVQEYIHHTNPNPFPSFSVTLYSHMSYSQSFLPNLTDMGSLLGTILGTILNYKRDPYVHC